MANETFDIVVAGAGSAGLAAALAAGSAGARVLVVEKSCQPGGMGSLARVHTFCGLYKWDGQRAEFANGGLARELPTRLVVAGAASGPVKCGRLWVMPHEPVKFAAAGRAWLAREPGIVVWWNAEVVGAHSHNQFLEGVQVRVAGGARFDVACRAVVDTTGDACVAVLAGAGTAMAEGAKLQRPAYIAGLIGLPAEWMQAEKKLQIAGSMVAAVQDGKLPPAALGAAFRPGLEEGITWCTLDLEGDDDPGGWQPLRPGAMERITVMARPIIGQICGHLSELTGRVVEVSMWPQQAGLRESRRLLGRQVLAGPEVLAGTRFKDEIAEVSWPMELRERPTGPRLRFPPDSQPAGIPAGTVQSRDLPNLFAAGRCLSCDHEAQAAIRVMGMCLATGEAAGRAAASMADLNQAT